MMMENDLTMALSLSRLEKRDLKSLEKVWVQVRTHLRELMAKQSLRCQTLTWVARLLDHNLLLKEAMLMLPQANMMMESASIPMLNLSRLVRNALKSPEKAWVLARMNLIEQMESLSQRRQILTWDNHLLDPSLLLEVEMST